MPWDHEVSVLDHLAHLVVDGNFMLLLLGFGSLRKTERILLGVVEVTLVLGEVLDGSFDDGGEDVPCSEFLFKTSDSSLEFLDLMSGTMESIPHDLGLMADAQIFESFLHPADRHGDEIEDPKGEVLEVETEHGQKQKRKA